MVKYHTMIGADSDAAHTLLGMLLSPDVAEPFSDEEVLHEVTMFYLVCRSSVASAAVVVLVVGYLVTVTHV